MEHYYDTDTVFTEVVGNSPTTRVMDLLLGGVGMDYSLSGIAELANVSWATIHEVIPKLEKTGLIVHTRDVGRAKMYMLNKENPYAKHLLNFYLKILNESGPEQKH